MRCIILHIFLGVFLCVAAREPTRWKNESEMEILRRKISPPPAEIMARLKKKFGNATVPDIYYLQSDEIPSCEKGYKTKMNDLEGRLKEDEIIPDVLKVPPKTFLRIRYTSNYSIDGLKNHTVLLGTDLTELECNWAPRVSWRAKKSVFYTLLYIGLDVPHRGNPFASPFLHWLVVNILENNVTSGEQLAFYIPPGAERSKGHHRHLYLVYEQPSRLQFDEVNNYINMTNGTHGSREQFFPQEFADKYNMGSPWAGNYFMSHD